MVYTVSITAQGQISIPAKIRKELGLKKKTKAIVAIEDGKMTVEPVKDIMDLYGSLKTNKKPLTNDQLHDMFAEYMAEEFMERHG